MPKGGSYDFNVDEASIWGATDFKKDMPNRILDLDTFEDDNVFKDVNKDKASDKNGFDAGDDKKQIKSQKFTVNKPSQAATALL